MERIQKALKKAERERSEAGRQPGRDSTEKESREAVAQESPAEVRYNRTRIIEVPEQVLLKNRLVSAVPGNEHCDVYRMLRTRVLQSLRDKSWNSFAVTSPATGSGKSLTAINLAISLAMEVVHTVLLVDLDLRRPSVHRYFDYQPEFGLSDYLFNDVPIQEILFSPGIDRLVVLPGRESIHNSAETLRSPKMVALVNELQTRYPNRLVVFDLPPMQAVDDALAFSPYTDAMLMVAESGITKREDLENAISVLKNTPIIGTVLNKSETSISGIY